MSGGEQQMLAIGRALMANPKLLLLDEPSLGLAPVIVDKIYEIIREINQRGVTILLVEQNANYALDVSKRGYVLETGKVALTNDSESLRNDPEVHEGVPRDMTPVFAAGGAIYLYLMYAWLLSAIFSAELARSKGYCEKSGLGTGLILTVLGVIIWLVIPPKDEAAEWHERKPWQRRQKPREAEMAGEAVAGGTARPRSPSSATAPRAAPRRDRGARTRTRAPGLAAG